MDYFNHDERRWQHRFANFRDRLLRPVLGGLADGGITPNQISLIGVLCLAIASVLGRGEWLGAAVFLGLYLLCDGVDGSLARFMGRAHRGGAVVDIVSDQLGVVFLAAASIHHLEINGVTALLFAAAYIAFIALATYANQLQITLFRFLRVKYLFYALYILSLGRDWEGILHGFMFLFAVYYWALVLIATRKIYEFYDAGDRG